MFAVVFGIWSCASSLHSLVREARGISSELDAIRRLLPEPEGVIHSDMATDSSLQQIRDSLDELRELMRRSLESTVEDGMDAMLERQAKNKSD